MDGSWPALAASAVSVGFLHTVLGPDHYLPFVAIGSARGWSRRKLAWITASCGTIHVASSLTIALVFGGLLGLGTSKVGEVFGWQGSIVAWALVVLGSAYVAWGLLRPRRHRHLAASNPHSGETPGDPPDQRNGAGKDITVWALVLVFAFGPCEALIPLVMLPTANGSVGGIVLVLLLFGFTTVLTMTTAVLLIYSGINLLPTARLARAAHPLAGLVVVLCGVAILLGL